VLQSRENCTGGSLAPNRSVAPKWSGAKHRSGVKFEKESRSEQIDRGIFGHARALWITQNQVTVVVNHSHVV
jgi:hypothetical protein